MNLKSKRTYTIGTVLIWLGVLAWAPYLFLLASGNNVSMFPFLAAHLVGVLGGTNLRRLSRDEDESAQPAKPSKLRRLSQVLILIGVLAWAPYFYLEYVTGQDVDITPFLAVHLTGVLGGGMLRASGYFTSKLKR